MDALNDLERKLGSLQRQMIWFRGGTEHFVSHASVREYAGQLACRYFPIRASNSIYLEPVIHAFCHDLVLAPSVHRHHHLWRYNYDDLDILAQFYRFSTPRQRYYHLAYGTLSPPTLDLFEAGSRMLGIHVADPEELFAAYYLEGGRARVAARVIESIAGLPCDVRLNDHYAFLELESTKRLRKLRGQGRFRFLRKGRTWMALGTHASNATVDLREQAVHDLFGYQICLERGKVRVSVSKTTIERAKAELTAILESESQSYYRLLKLNEFYAGFYHQRRFANAMDWYRLDEFVRRGVRKMLRSGPKFKYRLPLAGKKRREIITYLPRRSNFFWNLEELKCPYHAIWNPYRWAQPDRVQHMIVDSTTGKEQFDVQEIRS